MFVNAAHDDTFGLLTNAVPLEIAADLYSDVSMRECVLDFVEDGCYCRPVEVASPLKMIYCAAIRVWGLILKSSDLHQVIALLHW